MARYVILYHECPAGSLRASHWDLMIEGPAALRTWGLSQVPAIRGPVPCQALPDHRKMYLDYEGPLSAERGRVTRWDHGVYRMKSEREDFIALSVRGARLAGTIALTRRDAAGTCWQYAFHGFIGGGPSRRATETGSG